MITNQEIARRYYVILDSGQRPMQAYCTISLKMTGLWTQEQALKLWTIASNLASDTVTYPQITAPDPIIGGIYGEH